MNFIEKILGVKADKKAFREYRKRVDALPPEYSLVLNEMQSYIWNFAMDGALDLLYDVVSLFENSAAEGKRVLEVTGDDVMGFADELLREWRSRTWQGDVRAKFNERIHKKLEAMKDDGN